MPVKLSIKAQRSNASKGLKTLSEEFNFCRHYTLNTEQW